ncbi:MAG: aromatic amino acid lyase [Marinilabiliaceae bacterium]|nr:aromatic amino acid lyase [Marinilabiliaceae bacterium]
MAKIKLNGSNLTRHEVIDVAYNHARFRIDTSKLNKSLEYIKEKVNGGKIIYGVTTGFGSKADTLIKKEEAVDLQLNLLRSHACGIGKPFSKEIVRAIMVIRLNTLLKGNSGVQQKTVKQLAFLLNNDIHPVIPEQGSVGASGDLCPLSHMALPLIGEGEMEYKGKVYTTKDFLNTDEAKKIGFKAVTLSYKEGLALNNGTSVMAAVGTIALHKAEQLLKVCTLSSALIFESLCARKDSFAYDKIHEARNHSGQIEVAKWLTKLLDGSKLIGITQKDILEILKEKNQIPNEILDDINKVTDIKAADEQIQVPESVIDRMKANGKNDLAKMLTFAQKKWKPQDSYSIRCLPQVFGASKHAIDHVIEVVENELNALVDNPLIFADDDKVVSGGNFHGQPIALVMDYLKLALAEMGNITERQINKMVDSNNNDCMESFLVYGAGLKSGLMIPQYAAAAVVSENKVLVHPASADSIPTCENTEDHVSMGTIAARQALQIAENVEKITAIAILTGFYAVSMRLQQFASMKMECNPDKVLAKATLDFYKEIKKSNKEFLKNPVTEDKKGFLETDRFLAPEIESILKHFDKFELIVEKYLK